MTVNFTNTGFDHFGFFIGLALIFLFVVFAFNANKKYGIAYRETGIIFSFMVAFMFFGAKLLTISPEQWLELFNHGTLPHTKRLTILGAIAFGPLGLFIAKKVLGIKQNLIDIFAIPALIAMSIQRLGCLFAGCCYGIPTNSGFGVCYGPYTGAHVGNFNNGMMEAFTDFTPALHPIPVYLLLLCLASALLLHKNKEKFTKPGNYFLSAISLFIFGRFFIEFFRDPQTNGVFGEKIAGIKLLQYMLLAACSIIWSIIYFREKKAAKKISIHDRKNSFFHEWFLLGAVSLVTWLLFTWFTPMERSCLFLFITLAWTLSLSSQLSCLFNKYSSGVQLAFTLLFFVFVLPCGAQLAFDNSKDSCYSFKEFSGTFSFNTFDHYHSPAKTYIYPVQMSDGCGGYYTEYRTSYTYPKKYTHKVTAQGFSYAYYYNMGKYKRLYFKVTGFLGKDNDDDPEHKDNPGTKDVFNIFGLSAIGGADHKILGVEMGAWLANARLGDSKTGEQSTSLSQGKPEVIILPTGRIRVGYTKIIFFEARAGQPFVGLTGNGYPMLAGIGSGLGHDNGTILRLSIGAIGGKFHTQIGLKIAGYKNYGAEVNVGLGSSPNFNASLSYYFGAKPGN